MGRLADDYALVLRAGDTIEAGLARNLFGEADIPCLSPGPDFDLAELGIAAHNMIPDANLYVPRELRGRARDVLHTSCGSIDEDGRPAVATGRPRSALSPARAAL